MKYTFSILCISPILHFFRQQQEIIQHKPHTGVEYVGSHRCTLDAFIESVEMVPSNQGWDLDQVVKTVIDFWVNNSESTRYWKERLQDAGRENLLVARVADLDSLRAKWESLLDKEA